MFSDKFQKSSIAVVVLVLLYWACVLRGWQTVGQLQSLLIPFVLFALGTGILLSAFEWEHPTRSVFLVATAIPVLAIFLNLAAAFLVSEAHAEMGGTSSSPEGLALYGTAAIVSAVLHGVVALAGFRSSLWIRRQIQSMSLGDSALKSLPFLTGLVGLVTATVAGILSIISKR